MSADDPTCSTCRHSHPVISDQGAPLLECHRYPPQLIVIHDEPVAIQPNATEPCGEWSQA